MRISVIKRWPALSLLFLTVYIATVCLSFSKKMIALHPIDSLQFRRTYSNGTSLRDDRWDHDSFPPAVLCYPYDSNLLPLLISNKIADGDSMLTSRLSDCETTIWKINPTRELSFKFESGVRINDLSAIRETRNGNLIIKLPQDPGVSFMVATLRNTRGKNEFVLIRQYYFINGENFDVYHFML
jgi:hypothetical protein